MSRSRTAGEDAARLVPARELSNEVSDLSQMTCEFYRVLLKSTGHVQSEYQFNDCVSADVLIIANKAHKQYPHIALLI